MVSEVATLAVRTLPSLEVGQALFGFILVISGMVLAKFLDAMCKLAFVMILAEAGLQVVPAQFVF